MPRQSTLVVKSCEFCGTSYHADRYRHERSRYCSQRCQYAAKKGRPNPHGRPKVECICPICGVTFIRPFWKRKTYCSRACQYKREAPDPTERFWSHVDKTSSPHGCWLWCGDIRNGYGRFAHGQRKTLAHRFAYELLVGLIPDGLFLCHNCPGGDNPRCVNPAHLFVGTQLDNMSDAAAKGRFAARRHSAKWLDSLPRGPRVPHKLTPADVVAIRAAYAAGGVTQTALAKQYGVTPPTISGVIHRKLWRDV